MLSYNYSSFLKGASFAKVYVHVLATRMHSLTASSSQQQQYLFQMFPNTRQYVV